MNSYKKIKLSDFVYMNPTERLPKGTIARKISMDQIEPYKKFAFSTDYEPYSGGAKFRNEDTIMARITPCLENGKTAYISGLAEDEIAFGSTEYIVLRAKENISIPDFVYYLTISSIVREPAIKSMVGSSGRQRVQQSVLDELEIPLFSIADQQHIVDILGSIDDKIENNEKFIDALLKKLKLEYTNRFSYKEDKTVSLSHFVSTTIGGDWGKETAEKSFSERIVCIRGADIPEIASGRNGRPPIRYILQKNRVAKELADFEIIVEISGGSPTQSTGRCALITSDLIAQYDCPLICTNFCRALRCVDKKSAAYVYSAFSKMYDDNIFFNYENGTTGIKNLDLQSILDKELVYCPSDTELSDFYSFTNNIYSHISYLKNENNKLNELKQLYLKKFFG